MIDPHSPTWQALAQHIQQATGDAMTELAQFATSPERTQFLRGKLAALADISALLLAPPAHTQPLR